MDQPNWENVLSQNRAFLAQQTIGIGSAVILYGALWEVQDSYPQKSSYIQRINF